MILKQLNIIPKTRYYNYIFINPQKRLKKPVNHLSFWTSEEQNFDLKN